MFCARFPRPRFCGPFPRGSVFSPGANDRFHDAGASLSPYNLSARARDESVVRREYASSADRRRLPRVV